MEKITEVSTEKSSDTDFVFTILTKEEILISFDEPCTLEEALESFKEGNFPETSLGGESVVINIIPYNRGAFN